MARQYAVGVAEGEEFVPLGLIGPGKVETARFESFQLFPPDDSGLLGEFLMEFIHLVAAVLSLAHVDQEDMEVGVVLLDTAQGSVVPEIVHRGVKESDAGEIIAPLYFLPKRGSWFYPACLPE